MPKTVGQKRPKSGPRDRIVSAALELYYDRGYPGVSVDDVLSRAKSHKKSFYHYFPSRDDLGSAYLEEQSRRYLAFIEDLTRRHGSFEDFWKAWMRFLRLDAKRSEYRGCPFGLFAAQTPDRSAGAQSLLDAFTQTWEHIMASFLARVTIGGRAVPPEKTEGIVKALMMHYEGAVILFVMTRNPAYFKRLEIDGIHLAGALAG